MYAAAKNSGSAKYRQPRTSAADAARRVADRRALMLEIARRSNYGGPAQGFSGAPRSGRARLLEHKTFDYNPTGNTVYMLAATDAIVATTPFAPATNASLGCINQVPLGNSSITRVGRRLNITAVAIRGQIYSNVSSDVVKASIVLIWDRHPNKAAALPAWTTILTNQTTDQLTNKDYAPRFKILRRWDFILCGNLTAGQTTSAGGYAIDEFVKLKNKVTIWDAADTTGIVTNMIEGSLLLGVLGDESAASNKAPLAIFNTRVYFQDS